MATIRAFGKDTLTVVDEVLVMIFSLSGHGDSVAPSPAIHRFERFQGVMFRILDDNTPLLGDQLPSY